MFVVRASFTTQKKKNANIANVVLPSVNIRLCRLYNDNNHNILHTKRKEIESDNVSYQVKMYIVLSQQKVTNKNSNTKEKDNLIEDIVYNIIKPQRPEYKTHKN